MPRQRQCVTTEKLLVSCFILLAGHISESAIYCSTSPMYYCWLHAPREQRYYLWEMRRIEYPSPIHWIMHSEVKCLSPLSVQNSVTSCHSTPKLHWCTDLPLVLILFRLLELSLGINKFPDKSFTESLSRSGSSETN